jgi:uncharacterized protein YerC
MTLSSKDINIIHVKKLLAEGKKYQEIADIYNCNSGTIWYFCNKHGLCDRIRKPRTNISEKRSLIVTMLKEGKHANQIHKETGISATAITRLADRSDIEYTKIIHKEAKSFIPEIIQRFDDGECILKLAKEYNFSESVIRKHLINHGIDTSKYTRKYDVNHSFFDMIDTEEKAYVFGWYMSDGCVNNKGQMRIQLCHEDRDILEKIRNMMGCTYKLIEIPARNTSKPQVLLRIHSKELADKLITLGCPPAKSLILDFPKTIPPHLLHHFIRGYFDGDGSFNKKGTYASITSNDLFNSKLRALLETLGIETKLYYRNKGKSTCSLFVLKKDSLRIFVNWIYRDATVYMNRKRDKIKHLLQNIDEGV